MNGASLRVALVDDDASVRRAPSRLLSASDMTVEAFASAPDFLESLTKPAPDCLVLDLQMPGMSGLELQRRAKHDPDGAWRGSGVVDGAVFGLLGLIVAFTFSGAISRFDVRRNLIIEESNAIGTAYLRLDLLPAQSQPPLRESLRRYLDSRIRVYERFPDIAAVKAELEMGKELQADIWAQARTAAERVASRHHARASGAQSDVRHR